MERHWVDGACWLGCERDGLAVIYLGPIQWDGQHAPLHACEDCLVRLMHQATSYFVERHPGRMKS